MNISIFGKFFSYSILTGIIGILLNLIIAKVVSVEDLGIFKNINVQIQLIATISAFGFTSGLLTYSSENISDKERNSLLFYVMKLTGIIFVSVYCLYLLINPYSFNSFILIVLFFVSYISLVNNTMTVYFQSIKEFIFQSKAVFTNKLFNLVIMVILGFYYGLIGLLIGLFLSSLFLLSNFLFSNKNNINYENSDLVDHKKLRSMSIYAGLNMLIVVLTGNFDILFINYYISDKEVIGVYSFAIFLYFGVLMLLTPISNYIVPFISEVKNEPEKIVNWIKKLFIISFFLGLSIFVIKYFVFIFIDILYNDKFEGYKQFFNILVIKLLFFSLFFLFSNLFVALGKHKYNFYTAVIILPITLFSTYYFFEQFNIVGVAYAQVLTSFCALLIIYFQLYSYYKKHLKKQDEL